MQSGCCRFGLWRVAVDYDSNTVYRVRFLKSAPSGPVPVQFIKFLAGKCTDFSPLHSAALKEDGVYSAVYRAVSLIPYGETQTYGDIAEIVGTHPRVVGNAMARNPTPLIVPCHRVVGSTGIGGFSPDIAIKKELLSLEQRVKQS
ncbi:MAG TPA: MGMT family protein [Methanocorpusculum sp.]|nr:MGMT family protein [Methanocorpusculum sp.]